MSVNRGITHDDGKQYIEVGGTSHTEAHLNQVFNINDAAVRDGEGCRRGNSELNHSATVRDAFTDELSSRGHQFLDIHPPVVLVVGVENLFLLQ